MASGSGAFALVAVAALTSACASSGAVPRPFPTPSAAGPPRTGATAAVPPPAAGNARFDAYELTAAALALRGTRYREGGNDPAGFDCSGFTQYVFGRQGIVLPRDVKSQFGIGQPVEPTQIEPGDLIFFSTVGPGASHVAIALGGGAFVHAPSSTGVVRVEHLATTYWSQRLIGARRVEFD
jgi:cell wall-associated NlpC family hydrolase